MAYSMVVSLPVMTAPAVRRRATRWDVGVGVPGGVVDDGVGGGGAFLAGDDVFDADGDAVEGAVVDAGGEELGVGFGGGGEGGLVVAGDVGAERGVETVHDRVAGLGQLHARRGTRRAAPPPPR